MAELKPESPMQDNLTECPICRDQFDGTIRIPRRIPCCVQSTCQPCLDTNRDNDALKCPMCLHQHHLPGGVESLPKEPIILKILDCLQIQKRFRLSCTDCPESSAAIAQCENCVVFLCDRCLDAHVRNIATRNHTTATLNEIRDRPVERFRRPRQCAQHQYKKELDFYCETCSKVICVACAVVEHGEGRKHNVVSLDEAYKDMAERTDEVLEKLEIKAVNLKQSVEDLEKKKQNNDLSKQRAKKYINSVFNDIIKEIKLREECLLSEVDEMANTNLKLIEETLKTRKSLLDKVKSTNEYVTKMRSKADNIEDLQFMSTSLESLTNIIKETAQKVKFDRPGVTFVTAHLQHLISTIKVSGLVRKLTFLPKKIQSSVMIEPAEFPQVPDTDGRLTGEHENTISPLLELDSTTACSNVTVTDTVITNTKPDPPPPDTGCRIQTGNRVMASRPLVVRRDQKVMFHTRVNASIKEVMEDNILVFETALTSSPTDCNVTQPIGLSVGLLACDEHKPKMCLWIWYDGSVIAHVPMSINNNVGESFDVSLSYVLDGNTNKIDVKDSRNNQMFGSVMNVVFEKPLWVMMHVNDSDGSDIKAELISGNKASLSQRK